MILRGFKFLRGCLGLFLVVINLIVHALLTLIIGCLVWLIPDTLTVSLWAQRFVLLIPTSWSQFNFWILKLSTFGKWDIQGPPTLSRRNWYMLISNHQSWLDILVLGGVFCQKIPPLKFFMKKELLWTLPIAGVCCYLLGYPFMARHTASDIRKNPALQGQDIETTKKACEKFKRLPTTIINFVEGTRFTQKKHDDQQSPFHHLLKPKTGGAAVVINEMQDCLNGILDVTINYDTDKLSFFGLLSGDVRKITVQYDVIPITDEILGNYYVDRQFRKRFQHWLNILWQQKDTLLDELNHDH